MVSAFSVLADVLSLKKLVDFLCIRLESRVHTMFLSETGPHKAASQGAVW